MLWGRACPHCQCGPRKPTLLCSLFHLHVQDSFLVPILPAVPNCQGVIAPLQVKFLKGQLDHLGRKQRVRVQAGAFGEMPQPQAQEEGPWLCLQAQSPWDTPPHPQVPSPARLRSQWNLRTPLF